MYIEIFYYLYKYYIMSESISREKSSTPELPSEDTEEYSSDGKDEEPEKHEKHKLSKKIMRFICTCRQQTRIRKTPFGELIMSCTCGMIRRTSKIKYTDSSSSEDENDQNKKDG